MGANMMETLKQIQHDLSDQKTYMRNLHVINNNLLNFIVDKITFMGEKISDLPQVLITIGRLEQQVKKNNMLLFGNNETEESFEDRALMPNKSDHDDKNTNQVVEPFEKCIDNSEETSIHNSSKVSLIEDAKENGKQTKNDDSFQRADQYKDEVRRLITNEIKEVKEMIRDFMKIKHTSVEETAICCRHDAARISPTYLNTDQIKKLDDKFNNITEVYQSDIKEIKELIMESIAINRKTIQESSKPPLKQETSKLQSISISADQISQLNTEFTRITDAIQSAASEIKELIKNSVAASKLSIQEVTEFHKQDTVLRETNQSAIREIKELIKDLRKKIPIEGTASTVREKKTVQISPTYFSTDQLNKLNSELKRIADTYQETNIFPIIEVTPGAADKHPVMKLLRKGVFYKSLTDNVNYPIKLGLDGLKRSDVIDLITDYPDLTVNNVVRELMVVNKNYEWFKTHEHCRPQIFENGKFKYLPIRH